MTKFVLAVSIFAVFATACGVAGTAPGMRLQTATICVTAILAIISLFLLFRLLGLAS